MVRKKKVEGKEREISRKERKEESEWKKENESRVKVTEQVFFFIHPQTRGYF